MKNRNTLKHTIQKIKILKKQQKNKKLKINNLTNFQNNSNVTKGKLNYNRSYK